jgi:patatin-like phospholipase/acyl hydrolase
MNHHDTIELSDKLALKWERKKRNNEVAEMTFKGKTTADAEAMKHDVDVSGHVYQTSGEENPSSDKKSETEQIEINVYKNIMPVKLPDERVDLDFGERLNIIDRVIATYAFEDHESALIIKPFKSPKYFGAQYFCFGVSEKQKLESRSSSMIRKNVVDVAVEESAETAPTNVLGPQTNLIPNDAVIATAPEKEDYSEVTNSMLRGMEKSCAEFKFSYGISVMRKQVLELFDDGRRFCITTSYTQKPIDNYEILVSYKIF